MSNNQIQPTQTPNNQVNQEPPLIDYIGLLNAAGGSKRAALQAIPDINQVTVHPRDYYEQAYPNATPGELDQLWLSAKRDLNNLKTLSAGPGVGWDNVKKSHSWAAPIADTWYHRKLYGDTYSNYFDPSANIGGEPLFHINPYVPLKLKDIEVKDADGNTKIIKAGESGVTGIGWNGEKIGNFNEQEYLAYWNIPVKDKNGNNRELKEFTGTVYDQSSLRSFANFFDNFSDRFNINHNPIVVDKDENGNSVLRELSDNEATWGRDVYSTVYGPRKSEASWLEDTWGGFQNIIGETVSTALNAANVLGDAVTNVYKYGSPQGLYNYAIDKIAETSEDLNSLKKSNSPEFNEAIIKKAVDYAENTDSNALNDKAASNDEDKIALWAAKKIQQGYDPEEVEMMLETYQFTESIDWDKVNNYKYEYDKLLDMYIYRKADSKIDRLIQANEASQKQISDERGKESLSSGFDRVMSGDIDYLTYQVFSNMKYLLPSAFGGMIGGAAMKGAQSAGLLGRVSAGVAQKNVIKAATYASRVTEGMLMASSAYNSARANGISEDEAKLIGSAVFWAGPLTGKVLGNNWFQKTMFGSPKLLDDVVTKVITPGMKEYAKAVGGTTVTKAAANDAKKALLSKFYDGFTKTLGTVKDKVVNGRSVLGKTAEGFIYEGGEEVFQETFTAAVESFYDNILGDLDRYDKIGKGATGTEFFSEKTFERIAEAGITGALTGGIMGGGGALKNFRKNIEDKAYEREDAINRIVENNQVDQFMAVTNRMRDKNGGGVIPSNIDIFGNPLTEESTEKSANDAYIDMIQEEVLSRKKLYNDLFNSENGRLKHLANDKNAPREAINRIIKIRGVEAEIKNLSDKLSAGGDQLDANAKESLQAELEQKNIELERIKQEYNDIVNFKTINERDKAHRILNSAVLKNQADLDAKRKSAGLSPSFIVQQSLADVSDEFVKKNYETALNQTRMINKFNEQANAIITNHLNNLDPNAPLDIEDDQVIKEFEKAINDVNLDEITDPDDYIRAAKNNFLRIQERIGKSRSKNKIKAAVEKAFASKLDEFKKHAIDKLQLVEDNDSLTEPDGYDPSVFGDSYKGVYSKEKERLAYSDTSEIISEVIGRVKEKQNELLDSLDTSSGIEDHIEIDSNGNLVGINPEFREQLYDGGLLEELANQVFGAGSGEGFIADKKNNKLKNDLIDKYISIEKDANGVERIKFNDAFFTDDLSSLNAEDLSGIFPKLYELSNQLMRFKSETLGRKFVLDKNFELGSLTKQQFDGKNAITVPDQTDATRVTEEEHSKYYESLSQVERVIDKLYSIVSNNRNLIIEENLNYSANDRYNSLVFMFEILTEIAPENLPTNSKQAYERLREELNGDIGKFAQNLIDIATQKDNINTNARYLFEGLKNDKTGFDIDVFYAMVASRFNNIVSALSEEEYVNVVARKAAKILPAFREGNNIINEYYSNPETSKISDLSVPGVLLSAIYSPDFDKKDNQDFAHLQKYQIKSYALKKFINDAVLLRNVHMGKFYNSLNSYYESTPDVALTYEQELNYALMVSTIHESRTGKGKNSLASKIILEATKDRNYSESQKSRALNNMRGSLIINGWAGTGKTYIASIAASIANEIYGLGSNIKPKVLFVASNNNVLDNGLSRMDKSKIDVTGVVFHKSDDKGIEQKALDEMSSNSYSMIIYDEYQQIYDDATTLKTLNDLHDTKLKNTDSISPTFYMGDVRQVMNSPKTNESIRTTGDVHNTGISMIAHISNSSHVVMSKSLRTGVESIEAMQQSIRTRAFVSSENVKLTASDFVWSYNTKTKEGTVVYGDKNEMIQAFKDFDEKDKVLIVSTNDDFNLAKKVGIPEEKIKYITYGPNSIAGFEFEHVFFLRSKQDKAFMNEINTAISRAKSSVHMYFQNADPKKNYFYDDDVTKRTTDLIKEAIPYFRDKVKTLSGLPDAKKPSATSEISYRREYKQYSEPFTADEYNSQNYTDSNGTPLIVKELVGRNDQDYYDEIEVTEYKDENNNVISVSEKVINTVGNDNSRTNTKTIAKIMLNGNVYDALITTGDINTINNVINVRYMDPDGTMYDIEFTKNISDSETTEENVIVLDNIEFDEDRSHNEVFANSALIFEEATTQGTVAVPISLISNELGQKEVKARFDMMNDDSNPLGATIKHGGELDVEFVLDRDNKTLSNAEGYNGFKNVVMVYAPNNILLGTIPLPDYDYGLTNEERNKFSDIDYADINAVNTLKDKIAKGFNNPNVAHQRVKLISYHQYLVDLRHQIAKNNGKLSKSVTLNSYKYVVQKSESKRNEGGKVVYTNQSQPLLNLLESENIIENQNGKLVWSDTTHKMMNNNAIMGVVNYRDNKNNPRKRTTFMTNVTMLDGRPVNLEIDLPEISEDDIDVMIGEVKSATTMAEINASTFMRFITYNRSFLVDFDNGNYNFNKNVDPILSKVATIKTDSVGFEIDFANNAKQNKLDQYKRNAVLFLNGVKTQVINTNNPTGYTLRSANYTGIKDTAIAKNGKVYFRLFDSYKPGDVVSDKDIATLKSLKTRAKAIQSPYLSMLWEENLSPENNTPNGTNDNTSSITGFSTDLSLNSGLRQSVVAGLSLSDRKVSHERAKKIISDILGDKFLQSRTSIVPSDQLKALFQKRNIVPNTMLNAEGALINGFMYLTEQNGKVRKGLIHHEMQHFVWRELINDETKENLRQAVSGYLNRDVSLNEANEFLSEYSDSRYSTFKGILKKFVDFIKSIIKGTNKHRKAITSYLNDIHNGKYKHETSIRLASEIPNDTYMDFSPTIAEIIGQDNDSISQEQYDNIGESFEGGNQNLFTTNYILNEYFRSSNDGVFVRFMYTIMDSIRMYKPHNANPFLNINDNLDTFRIYQEHVKSIPTDAFWKALYVNTAYENETDYDAQKNIVLDELYDIFHNKAGDRARFYNLSLFYLTHMMKNHQKVGDNKLLFSLYSFIPSFSSLDKYWDNENNIFNDEEYRNQTESSLFDIAADGKEVIGSTSEKMVEFIKGELGAIPTYVFKIKNNKIVLARDKSGKPVTMSNNGYDNDYFVNYNSFINDMLETYRDIYKGIEYNASGQKLPTLNPNIPDSISIDTLFRQMEYKMRGFISGNVFEDDVEKERLSGFYSRRANNVLSVLHSLYRKYYDNANNPVNKEADALKYATALFNGTPDGTYDKVFTPFLVNKYGNSFFEKDQNIRGKAISSSVSGVFKVPAKYIVDPNDSVTLNKRLNRTTSILARLLSFAESYQGVSVGYVNEYIKSNIDEPGAGDYRYSLNTKIGGDISNITTTMVKSIENRMFTDGTLSSDFIADFANMFQVVFDKQSGILTISVNTNESEDRSNRQYRNFLSAKIGKNGIDNIFYSENSKKVFDDKQVGKMLKVFGLTYNVLPENVINKFYQELEDSPISKTFDSNTLKKFLLYSVLTSGVMSHKLRKSEISFSKDATKEELNDMFGFGLYSSKDGFPTDIDQYGDTERMALGIVENLTKEFNPNNLTADSFDSEESEFEGRDVNIDQDTEKSPEDEINLMLEQSLKPQDLTKLIREFSIGVAAENMISSATYIKLPSGLTVNLNQERFVFDTRFKKLAVDVTIKTDTARAKLFNGLFAFKMDKDPIMFGEMAAYDNNTYMRYGKNLNDAAYLNMMFGLFREKVIKYMYSARKNKQNAGEILNEIYFTHRIFGKNKRLYMLPMGITSSIFDIKFDKDGNVSSMELTKQIEDMMLEKFNMIFSNWAHSHYNAAKDLFAKLINIPGVADMMKGNAMQEFERARRKEEQNRIKNELDSDQEVDEFSEDEIDVDDKPDLDGITTRDKVIRMIMLFEKLNNNTSIEAIPIKQAIYNALVSDRMLKAGYHYNASEETIIDDTMNIVKNYKFSVGAMASGNDKRADAFKRNMIGKFRKALKEGKSKKFFDDFMERYVYSVAAKVMSDNGIDVSKEISDLYKFKVADEQEYGRLSPQMEIYRNWAKIDKNDNVHFHPVLKAYYGLHWILQESFEAAGVYPSTENYKTMTETMERGRQDGTGGERLNTTGLRGTLKNVRVAHLDTSISKIDTATQMPYVNDIASQGYGQKAESNLKGLDGQNMINIFMMPYLQNAGIRQLHVIKDVVINGATYDKRSSVMPSLSVLQNNKLFRDVVEKFTSPVLLDRFKNLAMRYSGKSGEFNWHFITPAAFKKAIEDSLIELEMSGVDPADHFIGFVGTSDNVKRGSSANITMDMYANESFGFDAAVPLAKTVNLSTDWIIQNYLEKDEDDKTVSFFAQAHTHMAGTEDGRSYYDSINKSMKFILDKFVKSIQDIIDNNSSSNEAIKDFLYKIISQNMSSSHDGYINKLKELEKSFTIQFQGVKDPLVQQVQKIFENAIRPRFNGGSYHQVSSHGMQLVAPNVVGDGSFMTEDDAFLILKSAGYNDQEALSIIESSPKREMNHYKLVNAYGEQVESVDEAYTILPSEVIVSSHNLKMFGIDDSMPMSAPYMFVNNETKNIVDIRDLVDMSELAGSSVSRFDQDIEPMQFRDALADVFNMNMSEAAMHNMIKANPMLATSLSKMIELFDVVLSKDNSLATKRGILLYIKKHGEISFYNELAKYAENYYENFMKANKVLLNRTPNTSTALMINSVIVGRVTGTKRVAFVTPQFAHQQSSDQDGDSLYGYQLKFVIDKETGMISNVGNNENVRLFGLSTVGEHMDNMIGVAMDFYDVIIENENHKERVRKFVTPLSMSMVKNQAERHNVIEKSFRNNSELTKTENKRYQNVGIYDMSNLASASMLNSAIHNDSKLIGIITNMLQMNSSLNALTTEKKQEILKGLSTRYHMMPSADRSRLLALMEGTNAASLDAFKSGVSNSQFGITVTNSSAYLIGTFFDGLGLEWMNTIFGSETINRLSKSLENKYTYGSQVNTMNAFLRNRAKQLYKIFTTPPPTEKSDKNIYFNANYNPDLTEEQRQTAFDDILSSIINPLLGKDYYYYDNDGTLQMVPYYQFDFNTGEANLDEKFVEMFYNNIALKFMDAMGIQAQFADKTSISGELKGQVLVIEEPITEIKKQFKGIVNGDDLFKAAALYNAFNNTSSNKLVYNGENRTPSASLIIELKSPEVPAFIVSAIEEYNQLKDPKERAAIIDRIIEETEADQNIEQSDKDIIRGSFLRLAVSTNAKKSKSQNSKLFRFHNPGNFNLVVDGNTIGIISNIEAMSKEDLVLDENNQPSKKRLPSRLTVVRNSEDANVSESLSNMIDLASKSMNASNENLFVNMAAIESQYPIFEAVKQKGFRVKLIGLEDNESNRAKSADAFSSLTGSDPVKINDVKGYVVSYKAAQPIKKSSSVESEISRKALARIKYIVSDLYNIKRFESWYKQGAAMFGLQQIINLNKGFNPMYTKAINQYENISKVLGYDILKEDKFTSVLSLLGMHHNTIIQELFKNSTDKMYVEGVDKENEDMLDEEVSKLLSGESNSMDTGIFQDNFSDVSETRDAVLEIFNIIDVNALLDEEIFSMQKARLNAYKTYMKLLGEIIPEYSKVALNMIDRIKKYTSKDRLSERLLYKFVTEFNKWIAAGVFESQEIMNVFKNHKIFPNGVTMEYLAGNSNIDAFDLSNPNARNLITSLISREVELYRETKVRNNEEVPMIIAAIETKTTKYGTYLYLSDSVGKNAIDTDRLRRSSEQMWLGSQADQRMIALLTISNIHKNGFSAGRGSLTKYLSFDSKDKSNAGYQFWSAIGRALNTIGNDITSNNKRYNVKIDGRFPKNGVTAEEHLNYTFLFMFMDKIKRYLPKINNDGTMVHYSQIPIGNLNTIKDPNTTRHKKTSGDKMVLLKNPGYIIANNYQYAIFPTRNMVKKLLDDGIVLLMPASSIYNNYTHSNTQMEYWDNMNSYNSNMLAQRSQLSLNNIIELLMNGQTSLDSVNPKYFSGKYILTNIGLVLKGGSYKRGANRIAVQIATTPNDTRAGYKLLSDLNTGLSVFDSNLKRVVNLQIGKMDNITEMTEIQGEYTTIQQNDTDTIFDKDENAENGSKEMCR